MDVVAGTSVPLSELRTLRDCLRDVQQHLALFIARVEASGDTLALGAEELWGRVRLACALGMESCPTERAVPPPKRPLPPDASGRRVLRPLLIRYDKDPAALSLYCTLADIALLFPTDAETKSTDYERAKIELPRLRALRSSVETFLTGQLPDEPECDLKHQHQPPEAMPPSPDKPINLPNERLYKAGFFDKATDGALYPDLLRVALNDGRIAGERGTRNRYGILSVCREYPLYRERLEAAEQAEARVNSKQNAKQPEATRRKAKT